MKNISVIGSTGYVGKMALEVIRQNPDRFNVVSLACGQNIPLLKEQVREFRPRFVSVSSKEDVEIVRKEFASSLEIASGVEGMVCAAVYDDVDLVVSAAVGAIGLVPTLRAVESGKTIAIANKEALVIGGELIMREAERRGVLVLPIDSEHSALHQCLLGERREAIRRLILTASGGPFRNRKKEDLLHVSSEEALDHPTWNMGKKITIDSATLMNKGLEVIEAHWLFGVEQERISVILHPQSIIHSMVEFFDGSVKCQMGVADMRIPIQYALTYPERIENTLESLDIAAAGVLEFFEPDFELFPCLRLAYDALKVGGTMPAVMNAADEVAVEYFLAGKIRFPRIPEIISEVMESSQIAQITDLDSALEADGQARKHAESIIWRSM